MTVYVEKVRAMEIFDSRGNPTHAYLSDGTVAKAEVPSGASTGEKEAVELRDGGSRLGGKGVLKAVNNVNTEINKALQGADPFNQAKIDRTMIELDGTPNKARLVPMQSWVFQWQLLALPPSLSMNHSTVTLVAAT